MPKVSRFYNFVNSKDETDLYLYGEIVNGSSKWDESDVTFKDFKDTIDSMTNTTLNIHVNSPGGSVFASNAIVTLLKSAKTKGVTINSYIDSLGASCASWIPLVADNVYIYRNSIMMVHKPMTCMMGANAKDLQKEIDLLNNIENNIMMPIYMNKVRDGITEEDIRNMVDEETWLECDKIMETFDVTLLEDEKDIECCVDKDTMKDYKNIPDNIKELLNKGDGYMSKSLEDFVNSLGGQTDDENKDTSVNKDNENKDNEDDEEDKCDPKKKKECDEDEEDACKKKKNESDNEDEKDACKKKKDESEDDDDEEDACKKKKNKDEEDNVSEMINSIKAENKELKNMLTSMASLVKDMAKAQNKEKNESEKEKYINKFNALGLSDMLENEDIKNMLDDCLDSENNSKLNAILVEAIGNKANVEKENNSKVVKKASEIGTEVDNLLGDDGLMDLFNCGFTK